MRKPLLILTLTLTTITAQAADKTDIAQRHATAEQAFQQGDIRTAIQQWEILAQAGVRAPRLVLLPRPGCTPGLRKIA